MKSMMLAAAMLSLLVETASAQYQGWRHSGSLYILTTPDGADLPATACERNFPLLVRLDKEWFDFSEAKPHGEDLRFAAAAQPLAYEIDEWDPARGTASIWVRVPVIRGNSRQELKVYWGKPDAGSESSGAAVFNASNGYLTVWHMNDPATDAVGRLTAKDTGACACAGDYRQGAAAGRWQGHPMRGSDCGLAKRRAPHSSEAWFRAEKSNVTILGWGNEEAQGKVVMEFASPPRIRMDCYFSGANVESAGRLPLSQWVHVVHTFSGGVSRLYVNGVLDGESKGRGVLLAIKSPARMYIGGWYNNYRFIGDIDEVRISNVVRLADWVKLQYENQKPLQTAVGPLVPPGTDFTVSATTLGLEENQVATLTAAAGGGKGLLDRKKGRAGNGGCRGPFPLRVPCRPRGGRRVAHHPLQGGLRQRDQGPRHPRHDPKGDSRSDLHSPGAGRMGWQKAHRSHSAACQSPPDAGPGRRRPELRVDRFRHGYAPRDQALQAPVEAAQNSGALRITLALDNGGTKVFSKASIAVTQPSQDAWVRRTPDKDEKPVAHQFFARDDKNEGTLHYNGVLSSTRKAESVFLKVYADGTLFKAESQKPQADGSYAFSVKLRPGLVKYQVEFGTRHGSDATVLHTVADLICGDAYLIDGQSNALAVDWGPGEHPDTSEWIRSFGVNGGDVNSGWGRAVRRHGAWEIGCWAMDLAQRLVEDEKIPICIINGAVGGTLIEAHQRNPVNPADPQTIYGRLLNRVRQARLTHGIRGVFWHQGENNQGTQGETGGYGWETYERFFVEMAAAWKEDYPNLQHYYVFQIWPNSCSMGGTWHSDKLRDVQRRLPRLYSNMSIMSTLGIKPEGYCHFPPAGYAELARLTCPLVQRDNYGKIFEKPITPPDVKRAYYTSSRRDEIALEFDQPMAWNDPLVSEFYVDGDRAVVAGEARGSTIRLKLAATSAAKSITYLMDRKWKSSNLLYGTNGIAALTFCDVAIAPSADTEPPGTQLNRRLNR